MKINNIFKHSEIQTTAKKTTTVTISTSSNFSSNDTIEGIMTNQFSMKLSATWEAMLASIGMISTIQQYAAIGGLSPFTTGIFTRKFYKGGDAGYIQITPSFRIVDWNGTGNVMNSARSLLGKCVPHGIIDKTNTQLLDLIGSDIKKAAASGTGFGEDLSALKNVGTNVARLVASGLQSATGTGSTPSGVYIKIGNVFNSAKLGMVMVIENVDVKFSKEMAEKGPLYADFDLQLSTRQAVQSGHIDKSLTNDSRVTITGGGDERERGDE